MPLEDNDVMNEAVEEIAPEQEAQEEVFESDDSQEEYAEEETQEASSDADPETAEELEEAVIEAIEDGASKEEVKSMIEEYTLNIKGKEVTKTLDLSDRDAVIRELQKAHMMSQTVQEKKAQEKEFDAGLKELMEDPAGTLADLGIDVEEFATQILSQKVEDMKKSPAQREQDKVTSELAAARKELADLKRKDEDGEFQKLVQDELNQFNDEVDSYWDTANPVIPRSPEMISRIANAVEWAESAVDEDGNKIIPDGQRAKVHDVIPLIEKEYLDSIRKIAEDSPIELLEEVFGKQMFDRYRKSKLPKKQVPNNVGNIKQTAQVKKDTKKKAKQSINSFFQDLDDEYGL